LGPVSKRILWIDIARAIGISLVVFSHVTNGLISAGMVNHQGLLFTSIYALYAFFMPLFFLLSGLNVDRSLSKGKKRFFQNKLWTIAYPYILWSLIQGSIQIALASYINHPPAPRALLTILWAPIDQFWFFYVLFFCHLLTMIFSSRLKFLAPVALLALLLHTLDLPARGILLMIEYMLPFYVLGIFLGKRKSGAAIKPQWLACVIPVSAIAYALGVHWGRIASHENAYSMASMPACLAGILLVIALSQAIERLSSSLAKFLAQIGAASMTIYILHVLAGAGIRVILTHLRVRNVPAHLVLGTISGVFLVLLIHKALERYELLAPLGLAPLRSNAR
jgi:fucose 4-O-acetylase-like acetyltransferase